MNNLDNNNEKLLSAIRDCDTDRVKELINTNIDISQFNIMDCDYTPLMLAINLENVDIVKILIEAGVNLHDSIYFEDNPLGLATMEGNYKIVKLLLEAGANPDIGGDSTPICRAIDIKHIDIIKVLIQWNADVNLATFSGITPLMIAASNGYLEIIEILLEEGANPDATDDNGDTALSKAAYFGHQEVFDYLLLFTSDLEQRKYLQKKLATGIIRKQRNHIKGNKFIKAVCSGNIDSVFQSINKGIQIDFYNENGQTALHCASKYNHLSIVQKLIEVGAYINVRDNDGNTPLSLAKELGYTEIVQLLLEAGAKEN